MWSSVNHIQKCKGECSHRHNDKVKDVSLKSPSIILGFLFIWFWSSIPTLPVVELSRLCVTAKQTGVEIGCGNEFSSGAPDEKASSQEKALLGDNVGSPHSQGHQTAPPAHSRGTGKGSKPRPHSTIREQILWHLYPPSDPFYLHCRPWCLETGDFF